MNALKGELVCVGRVEGPGLRFYRGDDDEYRGRSPMSFIVPGWCYVTDEQYAKIVLFQTPVARTAAPDMLKMIGKQIEARFTVCGCYSTIYEFNGLAPDHLQTGKAEYVRYAAVLGTPYVRRWTIWEELKGMALFRVASVLNFFMHQWYKLRKEIADQNAEEAQCTKSC